MILPFEKNNIFINISKQWKRGKYIVVTDKGTLFLNTAEHIETKMKIISLMDKDLYVLHRNDKEILYQIIPDNKSFVDEVVSRHDSSFHIMPIYMNPQFRVGALPFLKDLSEPSFYGDMLRTIVVDPSISFVIVPPTIPLTSNFDSVPNLNKIMTYTDSPSTKGKLVELSEKKKLFSNKTKIVSKKTDMKFENCYVCSSTFIIVR